MPIMATYSRSDARGTAHLLASMALDCIADPDLAREQEVALNNFYRLLEAFRIGALSASEVPFFPSSEVPRDRLSLHRPAPKRMKDVREALAAALSVAFPAMHADDAVLTVEAVLKAVAYPTQSKPQSAIDIKNTTLFFEELVRRLAAVG